MFKKEHPFFDEITCHYGYKRYRDKGVDFSASKNVKKYYKQVTKEKSIRRKQ